MKLRVCRADSASASCLEQEFLEKHSIGDVSTGRTVEMPLFEALGAENDRLGCPTRRDRAHGRGFLPPKNYESGAKIVKKTQGAGGIKTKQPPRLEYFVLVPHETGLLQQSWPNLPTTVV